MAQQFALILTIRAAKLWFFLATFAARNIHWRGALANGKLNRIILHRINRWSSLRTKPTCIVVFGGVEQFPVVKTVSGREFSTGDLFVVPLRGRISGVSLSVEVNTVDRRVVQQAVQAALVCPGGFCGPDLLCGRQFCYASVTAGIPSPGNTDGPFELTEFANFGELEEFEANLRQGDCHASINWKLPAKLNAFISASNGKVYSSKESLFQGLEMRLHLPDGWACTDTHLCQLSLTYDSQLSFVHLIPTEQHHSTFVRFRIGPVEEHGSKVNTTGFPDNATATTQGKGSNSLALRYACVFLPFFLLPSLFLLVFF